MPVFKPDRKRTGSTSTCPDKVILSKSYLKTTKNSINFKHDKVMKRSTKTKYLCKKKRLFIRNSMELCYEK